MGLFGDTPEKRGEKIAYMLQKGYYDHDAKQKVDELLAKGAVVPATYGDYGVLSLAIHNRHQNLIDHCIDRRIGLNVHNRYTNSPLLTALDDRMQAVAKRLIVAGADIKAKDRYGRTVLMLALRNGDLALARSLVKKKLSLQAKTDKGYSCVTAALESGKVEVLEYVLSAKPPLNTVYDSKPLLFAAIDSGKAEMFNLLVKAGCAIDITAKGPYGQTLLSYAREKAHKDIKTRLNAIAAKDKLVKEAAAKAARTGWRLNSAHEVCRIDEPEKIPYKVTEIFNFSSGLYTRINQNLETKAESTSVMNISAIANTAFVEDARAQLVALGGVAPENAPALGGIAQPAGKSVISKPVSTP